MSTSIIIAQMLGPYYVIVAVGVILNYKVYQQMIQELFKSTTLLYFTGIIALIFGLLIVTFHNIWSGDWRLIITITGWLAVLKGCCRILCPQALLNVAEYYQRHEGLLKILMVIVLIMGMVLTAIGYAKP